MKKRFIEWDLPLAEISEESSREKSIRHGHPSTLHIWWARRPLASSRATNFAALIDLPDDPKERNEITQLIKKISPWEAVKDGNDTNIKKAQQMIKKQWADHPPKILDPFAGGGSIPLEALRLGCETYANDYNPVAVFIEKVTLDWPQRFRIMIPHPHKKSGIDGEIKKVNLLNYLVDKWSTTVLEQVSEEIGQFYPKDSDGSIPVGYLWTKTIPCQNPSCGATIPMIMQFWLSKKDNRKIAYKPIIDKEKKKVNFEVINGDMGEFNPDEGTIARGNAICPVCKQVVDVKKIRAIAQKGKIGEKLIVVVLYDPKRIGKIYRIATEKDIEIFKKSEQYLYKKIKNWEWLDSPLPEEDLPPIGTLGFRIQRYGMIKWQDLFNARQKLALITFMEKIKSSYDKINEDCVNIGSHKYGFDSSEIAKAVISYLALGLDRLADFGSVLCVLNVTGGRGVVHTFGRQALPMCWDYFESNPFNPEAAGWPTVCEKNEKGIEHASNTSHTSAIISQVSATTLPYTDNYFDAIFTDPPYYDNVPYADLSDFFYVWLKRSIGEYFPDLFSTPLTPKTQEAIAEPMRQKNSEKFFENMISQSFKEIHRVLKPNGIATIVYAHKTTAAWETILNSLVNADLVVTASWPLHTERSGRLRGQGSAALASSIYMVCRKTERIKVGFYNEIQPQIKHRIEEKLQQFWDEGIAGGDFFISAIGPGMEIFSQYQRVEKLSGEQVTTSELLDYIRSVSTDFIVGKLLKNASSANIDSESDFYLAYRWTYQDNTVEYDDARKLSSASGVNLEDLWGPGGFVKKSGSTICVLGPKDRGDIDSIKNMVDVMHKTLLLWEKGKKDEIAELLAKTGFGNNPAFKQFCQAVAESLLNGNKEKQLLEGFLLGIDTYARAEVKTQKFQTDLKQYGVR